MDRRISKCWYIYIMKYYTTTKMDEFSQASTWTGNRKNIVS